MINILSYIGMSLQSEVCLWTVLGILRTIFDATLFQVNANLKQVWHMKMPDELSLPVQRVLRTTISGVMLVECFTVYVYLASYIVLLYPVFLEERPTLVLPWLLLAAVRNFLCELTSLALGLGACVLLGPARPPCIKFVITKLVSIMPAFYMWMLIFSYYHYLKMASAFKTFPAVLPPKDLDYGLELAVRRRRTKSLQGEDQLRKKLIASFYGEHATSLARVSQPITTISETHRDSTNSSNENIKVGLDTLCPLSVTSNRTISDIGTYEDWFGSEVVVPRDTDRILEQFVLMLLRIGVFMKKENADPGKLFSNSQAFLPQRSKIECPGISTEETETPPLVGSNKSKMASYLRDYPQIFMKKPSDLFASFNSPENRAHNNSNQNDIGQSSLSSEMTKDISLDTINVVQENKNEILLGTKNTNEIIIHSQEEIVRYDKDEKQVENIDNKEPKSIQLKQESIKLKQESIDSIESVINRMKVRVARNERPQEEEGQSHNNTASHIENHTFGNSIKVQKIVALDDKSKKSNKEKSGETSYKFNKKK